MNVADVGVAAILVLLLGAGGASPQERGELLQEPAPVPTFASKVELVTVDAVVVDSKGRPVRGLTADDFVIQEDGKRQKVESFEAFDLGESPEPDVAAEPLGAAATNLHPGSRASRSFVLLVDDMSLAPTRQEIARSAIARFLDTGLRDGDELIFATTSGDAWWSTRMPEGREDVVALAARVRGRNLVDTGSDAMSEWEGYRINGFESGTGAEREIGSPPAQSSQRGPGVPTSPIPRAPGSNLTERVVQRYLDRHLCDERAIDMCYQMVRGRARQVDELRVNRTRDTLVAIDRAVFALTGVRGRKALLLFGEGFLNDVNLGLAREVTGRCREANLAVYSLDVRGLMTGLPGAAEMAAPNTAELALMQLEQTEFVAEGTVALAEETGGFALRNTNDLAAGAERIANESRTYYLLGYAPPEGKGPRDWRKLKVEVKTPGLTVRARKGYTLRTAAEIARAAETPSSDRPPKGKAKSSKEEKAGRPSGRPAEVTRLLATAHDADAIPLRAMAYAFDGRPSGTVRTMLTIEIDTRALAGDDHQPTLILSIAASHRDDGQTQRLDQKLELGTAKAADGWLTLSPELELTPGVVQARVVVRDESQGRLGALSVRFVVPEPSGFRLSTPILTDRVTPADQAGPSRPVLTARREFSPEGRVYCQYQVFPSAGAGPIVAWYVLRRRDGNVVRESSPSAIAASPDGRLVRLLALSVDGMEAGDYEIALRVLDEKTGETREQVEPFRIVATNAER